MHHVVNSTFIEVLRGMTAKVINGVNIFAKKIDVEDVTVKGTAKIGQYGKSLLVDSNGVTVSGNLHVRDAILVQNLTVNSMISGSELVVSKEPSTQNSSIILRDGVVISSNGFNSTEGSMRCKDIELFGDMKAEGVIQSTKIISHGSITSRTLSTSESIKTPSIQSNNAKLNNTFINLIHVKNDCFVHGNFEVNGNVTLEGEVITINSPVVKMKEVVVENGFKSRSVFSSRLYTEDIAASGFITAGTITAKEMLRTKGPVEMEGRVTINSNLTVNNIRVSTVLSGTTIKAGSLNVGGIEARKVSVTGGEMTVDGLNVKEKLVKINELEKRIAELERVIKQLQYLLKS